MTDVEIVKPTQVATPSARIAGSGLPLAASLTLAALLTQRPTWAAVSLIEGGSGMPRVRINPFHNYTDVPSADGRGGSAVRNHDVTTMPAAATAAAAKQGAPPRGEPR